MKKYIIVFYTKEAKPPEIFLEVPGEMEKLFKRIVELSRNRSKFAVYLVEHCVGDFS